MLRYQDALRLVREALAAESGCAPEQFLAPGVRVFERPSETAPRPAAARRYPPHAPSFAAQSMGPGAVISASQELLPAIEPLFRGVDRDEAFEPERLATVNALLRPYELRIAGPYPRLLCGAETQRERPAPPGVRIALESSPSVERQRAFGPSAWPHAISRRELADGVTRTAALACAFVEDRHEDQLVGLATISADSDRLWQIGIDVAEPFRGRGVGSALTARLARHALELDRAPWYGIAPANLASFNTAVAAGFRFAWLEVFTVAIEPSRLR